MLRVVLFLLLNLFYLNNCFAIDDEFNKENTFNTKQKQKFESPQEAKKKNVLKRTQTPERLRLDEFKKKLPEVNTSFEVREAIKSTKLESCFSRTIKFKEQVVFQSDDLFDPQALVLSESGKWETNLARMKRGCSPIGHKGISPKKDALSGDQRSEILRKQKHYRIELHHLTQKDTETSEDPICEMTHDAHMGENCHQIFKISEDGKMNIVASSLKTEEAEKLLEEDSDYIMMSNVLHFRRGASLIDRSAFSIWREAYWQHQAKQIENKERTGFSTELQTALR